MPKLTVHIFDRGANGLPDTTRTVAELDGPRLRGVTVTHGAMWGCLGGSVSWACSREAAFTFAEERLGCLAHIYVEGTLVGWGLVWGVTLQLGRRKLTRSLEGFATRVRAHYNERDHSTSPPKDLGLATPIVADDTDLQAEYGIIEHQLSLGGASTTRATARATNALTDRKRLKYQPESGELGGGGSQERGVTLQLVGLQRTLWFQAYSAATAGTQEAATEIATILAAKAPWVSTQIDLLETTGVSVPRASDKYEYPGDLIKRIVKQAGAWVFQLNEDREPVLTASARASTAATYGERLDGTIVGAGGVSLDAWLVRPNAILRLEGLVPSGANVSAALEGLEHVYLAETTWSSASPHTVRYKPAVFKRGKVKP